MNLNGRRRSSNVEDRRGIGGKAAGGGVIALIIGGIVYMLSGGSLTDYIGQNAGQLLQHSPPRFLPEPKTCGLRYSAGTG